MTDVDAVYTSAVQYSLGVTRSLAQRESITIVGTQMNAKSKCTMAFVLLWAAMAAHAASAVKVTPASGHPTAVISVSGTAFADLEAIDVYVDTVDTLLLVSSATGTFSGSVTIPATASPGTHYITAIGRKSGDAAQKAFTVSTNWSEFHFGTGRKGFNPYENVIDATNISDLDIAWQATTGSAIQSSPAVANGVVYVGSSDDNLYAYRATTGALLWSATTGGSIFSSPAVANGVVYVGSDDGYLYAFKATTGALLWSETTGSYIESSPAVANGVVYVGSFDDNLYAFKATTGEQLWQIPTGNAVNSSPAVTNGVVYVGSYDDKLYAYHATTGALLWSATTGGSIFSSPAVANGVVYVGSTDDNLYAYRATTGALLWSATTGGDIFSSPAVANGVVYVGSDDDNLYAYNATTGALLWSATTGSAIYSSPAVANGVVYVGSEDANLYAFALGAGNDAVYKRNIEPPALNTLHPDLRLEPARSEPAAAHAQSEP
jgi:outer membrane protein assembly factor BamB